MPHYDTIVIGSGAGGLTAALALARKGQKVLVLEQHTVPGGWCHSFTLEGYRFSPGVHYIGELQPGGRMRRIYEGLGVASDMTFLELNPDGFDHIITGRGRDQQRFDIPSGKERYKDRLAQRFPSDARGVRRYVDTVEHIGRELDMLGSVRGLRDLVTLPYRARHVLRYAMSTVDGMLDGMVKDPFARAVLTMQAGDHGMPPSKAPALMHAAVQDHYLSGGWYPKGGAFAIPRAFLRALKRHGAEVKLATRVSRILVEGRGRSRRAIGVRLEDGTEIRADRVVSNADPGVTFGKLLDPELIDWWTARRLARTTWSVGALSLFFAVDADVRAMGLDSGNFWYSDSTDVSGMYSALMDPKALSATEIPGVFLTCTTLKDPGKLKHGHHTMEAFAFVQYEAFRRWAKTTYGERPADYLDLKRDLTAKMLDALDRFVPGLSQHVVFTDLGTPLTNEFYCESTEGGIYGTEKRLGQIGPMGWPLKTRIDGLWMCGASTMGHGVMGATSTGLVTAAQILGASMRELLDARGHSLTLLPAEDIDAWPEPLRQRATAAHRRGPKLVANG